MLMDVQGSGEAQSKSGSVLKHEHRGLTLQQEKNLLFGFFVILLLLVFFHWGEINSLFTGKCMWGEEVMNFQIKLGKCFQTKEVIFNHIFLRRMLNVGSQQNF